MRLSLLLSSSLLLLPFLFSSSDARVDPVTVSNAGSDYEFSTGVTRRATWVVTVGPYAPDGFTKQSLLINGTTPGPTLVGDEGDWVEITIVNNCGKDITIHWHGIEQRMTPWSDGVPGVTQFPIRTGSTFIYEYRFTQSGAYWYHAHIRALVEDGLRGSMYIYPRPDRPKPFSLIPGANVNQLIAAEKASKNLLLSDWSHLTSSRIHELINSTQMEALCTNAVLINGKGQQTCPSPAVFAPYNVPPRNTGGNLTALGCVTPFSPVLYGDPASRPDLVDPEMYYTCRGDKSTVFENVVVDPSSGWVALNLVNGGANWPLIFTIDEHRLWVFAVDGAYIEPLLVDGITVNNGERYQVFIKLDKTVGSRFNIRVAINTLPQVMTGYALFSYASLLKRSPRATLPLNPADPRTTASSVSSIRYGGEPINPANFTLFTTILARPFPANPPPGGPADLTIRIQPGPQGPVMWALNREPFESWREVSTPPLFDPTVALGANLALPYESGQVVDLVIDAAAGNPPHPIHKHGVKGWIIGQAAGVWNWTTSTEALAANPAAFNLANPPFRDNFETLAGPSWTVVRFVSNDPAPIFIHCHISDHLSSGMAAVLLESIQNLPPIPAQYITYAEMYSGQDFSSLRTAETVFPASESPASNVVNSTTTEQ